MKTKETLFAKKVNDCLDEMYQRAFPPISLADFDKTYKDCPKDEQHFRKHYLPKKNQDEILEYYINEYDISDKFNEHLEFISQCLLKGYHQKVHGENGKEYVKTLPLEKLLHNPEDVKIIKDLLSNISEEYCRDYNVERFRFNVFNWAPTTNKQEVIDYWKSQGIEYDPSKFDDKNFPSIWDE